MRSNNFEKMLQTAIFLVKLIGRMPNLLKYLNIRPKFIAIPTLNANSVVLNMPLTFLNPV